MSFTPEEKEFRVGKHGGHDAAAIAGLHPFLTPHDIYRKHVLGWEQDVTERMEEGEVFEASILELYRRRTSAELCGGGIRTHSSIPWAIASLDQTSKRDGDALRIVDAKHPSIRTMDKWGPTGTDDVPEYVFAQMQWYMGVTGYGLADVATYFGGGEFRLYTLEADQDIFHMLLGGVRNFRENHILPQVPPPVDGSESCTDLIKSVFPQNTGTVVTAGAEAEVWAGKLMAAREMVATAEQDEREAKNHMLELIGEADKMLGEGWSISNKRVRDSASIDWEAIARHLAAMIVELDIPESAKAALSMTRLTKEFIRVRSGYRRFMPKWANARSD